MRHTDSFAQDWGAIGVLPAARADARERDPDRLAHAACAPFDIGRPQPSLADPARQPL